MRQLSEKQREELDTKLALWEVEQDLCGKIMDQAHYLHSTLWMLGEEEQQRLGVIRSLPGTRPSKRKIEADENRIRVERVKLLRLVSNLYNLTEE